MNSVHSQAGCVFLPDAVKGSHLCVDYMQSPDGHASAHSFKLAGAASVRTAVFAKQTLGTAVGEAVATCIETGGTNIAPTSVQLIYTPDAAATNTLGTGSMIHFYCPASGVWLVKMELINLGTGITGVWTVA